MLSVDDARAHILAQISPLSPVTCMLTEALGGRLAEAVSAPYDAPSFDRSAMDGYAVRWEDISRLTEDTSASVVLPIAFEAPAGAEPNLELPKKAACRVMTGGPVPAGADTVVMREDTEEAADEVRVLRAPRAGCKANIRWQGSYFRANEPVLHPGALLDAGTIGLLASIRRSRVLVHRRPRVAVVSTGNELVELDQTPKPGQIVNSSAYMLSALITEAGGDPVVGRIARDTVEDCVACLREAIGSADLVVTIGGVSVGDYDVVRAALESVKAGMGFWKVRMKPGKPLAFGMVGATPLIGLPGNPVSSHVAFYQFVYPAIRRLAGDPGVSTLPRMQAELLAPMRSPEARRDFQRGTLRRHKGGFGFLPFEDQTSGNLLSIVAPHAFAVIPEGVGRIEAGDVIEVQWLGRAAVELG